MIATPEYCQMMAKYNAWQNAEIRKRVEELPVSELELDRGAFFGSIRATLNHILWADMLWMSRFGSGDEPTGDHLDITPTIAAWGGERFRVDGRITLWAEKLTAVSLVGDMTVTSKLSGKSLTRPMGMMVAGFFNHQTHHRGQVHAMMTSAGIQTADTDIVYMPGR